MTYRELADRCDLFDDVNYDFSKEVDAWEDFFVLYDDRNDDSTDDDLLNSFTSELDALEGIIHQPEHQNDCKLLSHVAFLQSDFRRIKRVLQALLRLDGIFMLYKNHMDEAKLNLMKETNNLVRDVYELDKLEETNDTTETTTSGSPS